MTLVTAIVVIAWAWFAAGDQRLLLRNTLLVAGTSSFLAMFFAVPLGAMIARLPDRDRLTAMWIFLAAVPAYWQGIAWESALFGEHGVLATVAISGGAARHGIFAVIGIQAVAWLPWGVLFGRFAASWADKSLEETTLLAGGRARAFRFVVLPHLSVWAMCGWAWSFLAAAGEMTLPARFAVRTWAEDIYSRFAMGTPLSEALTASFPAMGVVVGFAVVMATSAEWKTLREDVSRPLVRVENDGRPSRLAWLAWSATLVVLCVPLAGLTYRAGLFFEEHAGTWQAHWRAASILPRVVATNWELRHAWMWSLAIAGCAAMVSVLLAAATLWCFRYRDGVRTTLLFAGIVIYALPAPWLAVGWIELFSRAPWPPISWLYDHTIFAPVLGCVSRVAPIVAILWEAAWRTFPREQLRLAALHGAGAWDVFAAYSAARRGPIVAIFLTAFLLSMTELPITLMLLPPGITTVPVEVAGLWHAGIEERVAAVCLGQGFVLAGGFWAVWRWWRSRTVTV
ncbi:amino acid ABC transporter permease [Thermostilla marina]